MASPDEIMAEVRAAMANGDLQEASKLLKVASAKWKAEPEFAVRHGGVLEQLGDFKGALKIYRKVLSKFPERQDACERAAQCALKSGKHRLAEKLFSRAIGMGMDLDSATVGIAQSYSARSRYHEAWQKAITQYESGDCKSRELYDLLKELSPIVGSSVPKLDEFDSAILPDEPSTVRRSGGFEENTEKYGVGTVEAMAGIARDELVLDDSALSELLSPEGDTTRGDTGLGIDLSNLDSSSIQKPPEVTQFIDSTSEGKSQPEEGDDPFADWPET